MRCWNPRPKPFPPDRTALRGVFFGTSEFAVPALRAFAASLECVLVVTQPDRPSGRGLRLTPTPVKSAALEMGLEVFAPERLRDAVARLEGARADLFAVASYGKIVPESLLGVPRLGALNVHPSLLPLYRGATPLQAQLRDGVRRGGVTIIMMDAGMDTGDIVLQEASEIGARETYGELHERFAELGATLLERAVVQAAAGELRRVPQAGLASAEEIAATMTRPLDKADLAIDWSWTAESIANHVRSLAPAPGARAELAGERVKLLSVVPAHALGTAATGLANGVGAVRPGNLPGEHTAGAVRERRTNVGPGTIVGVRGAAALVACGDGVVAVERLVPPNRDAQDGARFAQARLPA